jgi:hypothetical protein
MVDDEYTEESFTSENGYVLHDQCADQLRQIAEKLERLGVTPTWLANHMGFSRSQVWKVFRVGQIPSYEFLLAASWVLNFNWTYDDLPPYLGTKQRPNKVRF